MKDTEKRQLLAPLPAATLCEWRAGRALYIVVSYVLWRALPQPCLRVCAVAWISPWHVRANTVGTFSSQWRPRFLKARWDLRVVKNMWNGSFSTTWTCSHSKIRQISKRNSLSLYKLRSCIQNLCSMQSIKSSALKFNWKLRCKVPLEIRLWV